MSLAKNSAIYLGFSIASRAVPFLLIPFLTRHLSTSDYGIYSMYTIVLTFVVCISSLGQETVITRNFFDFDAIEFKSQLTSSVFFQTITLCLIAGFFSIYFIYFPTFLEIAPALIVVLLFTCFGQNVTRILLTLFQIRQRPILYGALNSAGLLLEVCITILLIKFFASDWRGRAAGLLASAVICTIISFGYLYAQNMLGAIRLKYLRPSLLLGAPILLHSLLSLVFSIADRLIIQRLMGVSDVGIYAVGFQIGSVIMILATAFNQAWTPWLFERLSGNATEQLQEIVKYSYIYAALIMFLTACFSIISVYLGPYFISVKFVSALEIVPWIAFAGAFTGLYYLFGNYLIHAKKTSVLAWITAICSVVGVSLTFIMVGKIGIKGAAFSLFFTQALYFILTAYFANKYHPMPWRLK